MVDVGFRIWLESKEVEVVHETDHHHAEILLTQGVEPSFKRKIPITTYQPGRGISREGLYVNYDKLSLGGYGFVKLFLRIPIDRLAVSPELEQNGITDIEYALDSHDGAITVGKLPPSIFYKVDVRGQKYTPDEYLKSRGLENVPSLPSVTAYEDWLRKNAERLHLRDRNINQSLTDYERSNIRGKMAHADSMRESD